MVVSGYFFSLWAMPLQEENVFCEQEDHHKSDCDIIFMQLHNDFQLYNASNSRFKAHT